MFLIELGIVVTLVSIFLMWSYATHGLGRSTEIWRLDGERQSLAYNHHHELITTRDTIAAMKTQAKSTRRCFHRSSHQ
ncbi:hypothetical protein EDD16DRAFT_1546793 [Pisolithus croceorrhizus]|nr:hypothetical protein EDD16DRAFT_1546793 [Pisolithus croceorrhizus]